MYMLATVKMHYLLILLYFHKAFSSLPQYQIIVIVFWCSFLPILFLVFSRSFDNAQSYLGGVNNLIRPQILPHSIPISSHATYSVTEGSSHKWFFTSVLWSHHVMIVFTIFSVLHACSKLWIVVSLFLMQKPSWVQTPLIYQPSTTNLHTWMVWSSNFQYRLLSRISQYDRCDIQQQPRT